MNISYRYKIQVLLCCYFTCLLAVAQSSQSTISGTVRFEDAPIADATVTIFRPQGKETVRSTLTASDGTFTLEVPKEGRYKITITHVSFTIKQIPLPKVTEDIHLGAIYLERNTSVLEDVIIQSEKSTYKADIDKKVYEVANDVTTRGGTVQDILDNVPSVSVDVEGTVALRGNSNVRILIDGKPSGLAGNDANETLRQLAAEQIERIEVITTPSARYDAEGSAGIVNIILKKSKRKGTNGALTLYSGIPVYLGATGNLNHRIQRINLFTTTGYQDREILGNAKNVTTYSNETEVLTRTEERDFNRKRKTLHTNTGIAWDVSDKATVTTAVSYRVGDYDNTITNQIQDNFVASDRRVIVEEEDHTVFNYTVGYLQKFEQPKQQFSIDFQSERFVNDKFATITMEQTDRTELLTINTTQKLQLLQTDYRHPFTSKTILELGYRGSFKDVLIFNEIQSIATSETETENSDVLRYTEDVNAVYTQLQTRIAKFSVLAGFRLEGTRIGIQQEESDRFTTKRYTDIFPSATLKYTISEEEDIAIGYSRRVQRPRLRFINPFPSRTSETSLFQGNPALDPSYANTVEITYQNTYDTATVQSAIYYTKTKQAYTFIATTIGATNEGIPIIQRQPINLTETYRYGIESAVTYSPMKAITCIADVNLFKQATRGEFKEENLDADMISWLARLQTKIKLPAKINTQISMSYRGPTKDGQTRRKGIFNTSIGISKTILGTKGVITLAVQDVFNTRKRRLRSIQTDGIANVDFQYRERSAVLSFNYRFNQKKKREQKNIRTVVPDFF